MRKAWPILAAGVAALVPVSISAQFAGRPLDPQYVAEARRQHAEVVREFGGAESGPRAAYVQSVGRRVAQMSGVSNGGNAIDFTLLNSAVPNAFSVPGGYVYMTRQLMGLMDDESELAFVLGHEVGHIAAHHAQQREALEERAIERQWPLIMLGNMVGGNLGTSLALKGLVTAKLQTLSFSREQEYEADTLGLRYMIGAGYDPAGAEEILAAINRQSALESRLQGKRSRQLPEWALTHPLTENRIRQTDAEARATGRVGSGVRNRDQFLRELEGVYIGDDPAQGIIQGRTFIHPDLKIRFTVPVGYLMQNGTDAVSINGSAGEAQFGGGRFAGSLDSFILADLRQMSGEQRLAVPRPRHLMINGIPAAMTTLRAQTDSGPVDVSVIAYQWAPERVYYFATMAAAGAGIGPFTSMINSIRKVTPAEAAAIRPRVIHVQQVRPGDTVQSLSARMAYGDYRVERFLALNGLSRNARLVPGKKVKLIVYGARVA
jgi:predicted Zn-dependent protease